MMGQRKQIAMYDAPLSLTHLLCDDILVLQEIAAEQDACSLKEVLCSSDEYLPLLKYMVEVTQR